MTNILYDIENLQCSYIKSEHELERKVVLEIAKLQIPRGKRVFIVGESGIGKSTILETLGMMNNTIVPNPKCRFIFYTSDESEPTDMQDLWRGARNRLADFRLKNFSFIFQSTNLMRNFTALENVAFTRMLQGYTSFSCMARTRKTLVDLGLEHISDNRMAVELSGGQQQRLAFARAILPDFTVLFGDEPTGNLDAETAYRVMEVLNQKLDEHKGASAIIVSHDMHLAITFADIIIKIKKCMRSQTESHGEIQTYGFIDESCVYHRSESHIWSNGTESKGEAEFEIFLRTR